MKKLYPLLFLAAWLLASCSNHEKDIVSISGVIKGLGNDTLYIYGTDRLYNRLDTLTVKEDIISTQLEIDTLISAWLRFSDGTEIPIYMNKGEKIEINGSATCLDSLYIKGNTANEKLSLFRQKIERDTTLTAQALEDSAKVFIQNNLTSPASLYVLDKYLVQKTSPDFPEIKKLIEGMTGELKEYLYVENLLRQIETAEKTEPGKMAPYFQLPSSEGKDLKRTDFKDKYLLLHFWASWDEKSKESNQMLRKIYKDKKKHKDFEILGISLDTDKDLWKEAIENDTLTWKQACDCKGWNSDIIEQFNIRALPTNILLTPTGKIEGRNLTQEQLEERLKEIVKEKKQTKK